MRDPNMAGENFRNVSQRTGIHEALRLSEERLRMSLQASPAVVFNQDRDLRYTWLHNPISPYLASDVLGKTDFDFFPPDDASRLQELKRAVLQTGVRSRQVVRVTLGEPRFYDLTVEPLRDLTGAIVGVIGAAWDITEQKQLEEEQRFLAEAGELLMREGSRVDPLLSELGELVLARRIATRVVVELAGDGKTCRKVVHSDPDRQSAAAALEALTVEPRRPSSLTEALAAHRSTLVSPVTPEYLESVAQNSEHLALLLSMDIGSLIVVPLVARERLLGAFAFVSSPKARTYRERDVAFAEQVAHLAALGADNARLHDSLQQAVAARDEVLGIVAHDLRSPINTASLATSMLLRLKPAEDRRRSVRRTAETIDRALQNATRLIRDLLDVAKMENGRLAVETSPISPKVLVGDALEALGAAAALASLELKAHVPHGLTSVMADRERVLQVFTNLIGNALKFLRRGGAIRIGAEQLSGEVRFYVNDTGPGIDPHHVEQLFERFWQGNRSDRRGAGLGLPIAKGIVLAHGGRIWVESTPGVGSTFSFTLPAKG